MQERSEKNEKKRKTERKGVLSFFSSLFFFRLPSLPPFPFLFAFLFGEIHGGSFLSSSFLRWNQEDENGKRRKIEKQKEEKK